MHQKIAGAILLLLFGLWAITLINKLILKILIKSNVEETLQKFLLNLSSWILKVLLIITVIAKLGVPTTSFVAIIGAAGLAVGLALQGSLANFAGGALIMIFKPFKIGDFIEAQGVMGSVKEIQIFVTTITSPDNKKIIIPNGSLSNGSITNFNVEGKRRVDLAIGIGYNSNIKDAKDILMTVLKNHPDVLSEPAPAVVVTELADSSVNLAIRPWTKPESYWKVYSEVLENAKMALDAANIEIPFPQTDVHLHKK